MTKVVILAGGFGTRLHNETRFRPKPMVEIGEYPILWHIMNIYSKFGFNEFIVALGYKAEVIKHYFWHYYSLHHDFSVQLNNGHIDIHSKSKRDWIVHLIDTGLHTETGGRIKRLAPWIGNETFMMTYGDGLADIDIQELMKFHLSHRKLVTTTVVHPPARFGSVAVREGVVTHFAERSHINDGLINGGFFVIEPEALDYIEGDTTSWEGASLKTLAQQGHLMAYQHHGFWQCMDTAQEQHLLNEMWREKQAPWKVWEE